VSCPMRIAKEAKSYGRFRESSTKDKPAINYVDDDTISNEEEEVCVAEWVDIAKDKLFACSFPRPNPGKKDTMKYTFDVSKCDKLFDVLLQNKVIHLSEGHVVPSAGQPVKGKYSKWHGTFDEAGCWSISGKCEHDQL
jgi:hypothetical protein